MQVGSMREAMALQGTNRVVQACVTDVISAGHWSVDIGIPAVLTTPGRPGEGIDDPTALVGRDMGCVIVEVSGDRDLPDMHRVTVVPVMTADEAEAYTLRHETVSRLRPGEVLPGRVHALVTFGAFVDVGDVYGLIHISQMGLSVTHPKEVLREGQQVEVEVLDIHLRLQRVALRLR